MPPRSLLAFHASPLVGAALGLALVAGAPGAAAQVELGSALRSLEKQGLHGLPRALLHSTTGRVAILAEYPADSVGSELLVGGRYRPLWLLPEEIAAFASDHPDVKLNWAPPRHVLLDEAAKWVGSTALRNETGLDGTGVVVGIVDTGVDVTHRDLRTADGKSRVRWLLDFSRSAVGNGSELEQKYGCTGDSACAIYSNEDLDALLNDGITGNEPQDTFGHGTHVASLAAGNGLASKVPRYIGVA